MNPGQTLLFGLLTGLVLFHEEPINLKPIAGAGFCGGYTTFSTASFETVRLLQQRHHLAAALNALGTIALTLGAAALGRWVVKP